MSGLRGNFPIAGHELGVKVFRMKASGNGHEEARGVIRHRTTDEYYKGGGEWTPYEELAMEFRSLSKVIEEAQRYEIKDCCEFIIRLARLPGFAMFLPL